MIIVNDTFLNDLICLMEYVSYEYSWVYILDPEMDSFAVYTHWLKTKEMWRLKGFSHVTIFWLTQSLCKQVVFEN